MLLMFYIIAIQNGFKVTFFLSVYMCLDFKSSYIEMNIPEM